MLNDVFSDFDRLAERHGLEKIKTIGDAYMVAGGLDGGEVPAGAVAAMALEAQQQIALHPGVRGQKLRLHVGVSTGPVAAGVIGVRRFIYDLWGNAVNVASRLSGEAAPGTILVDEPTFRALRDRYAFGPARTVEPKGKDPMQVYVLVADVSPAEPSTRCQSASTASTSAATDEGSTRA